MLKHDHGCNDIRSGRVRNIVRLYSGWCSLKSKKCLQCNNRSGSTFLFGSDTFGLLFCIDLRKFYKFDAVTTLRLKPFRVVVLEAVPLA